MSSPPTCSIQYNVGFDANTISAGKTMFIVDIQGTQLPPFMFEIIVCNSTVALPPTNPSDILITAFTPMDQVIPISESIMGLTCKVPVDCTGLGVLSSTSAYPVVMIRGFLSNMEVTEWSNPLTLFQPPTTPSINSAVYDVAGGSYGPANVYIQVNPPMIDPSNNIVDYVQYYIVSYYAVAGGSSTGSWIVSPIIQPYSIAANRSRSLQVTLPYSIQDTTPIYVTVNGVNVWTDASNNEFYSLSAISNTVTATKASHGPPTLSNFPWGPNPGYSQYNVYNGDHTSQTILLAWQPPASSFVTPFAVSYYIVERQINQDNFQPIENVPPSPDSPVYYTDNIGGVVNCGDSVSYRITAVSTGGVYSPASNVISANYFAFSSAPLVNNQPVGAIDSRSQITVTAYVTNPINVGCNSGVDKLYWYITDSMNAQKAAGTITYVPGQTPYQVVAPSFAFDPTVTYQFNVYIQTDDTNSNNLEASATTSINITLSSTVPVITNLVYNSPTLSCLVYSEYSPIKTIATLAWQNPTLPLGILNYISVDLSAMPYVYDEATNSYVYTISFNAVLLFGQLINASSLIFSVANDQGVGSSICIPAA